MRRLIAILALMLIANVLSAQVQVSDTLSKNRFQVRINGTIKGNYSKGSCYADANSAGNIAIKFSGNDKLVTAYQAPSVYVVNGQTSSNRDSVLNRLHIIMLDFQCSTPEPPIETFTFCGSPLFDFWSSLGTPNDDTIAYGVEGSPISNLSDKVAIHYWGSGIYFDDYNYGNCVKNAICKANYISCLSVNEIGCSEIDTLGTLVGGEGLTLQDTVISCLSDNIAWQTVQFEFDAIEDDTLDIYSFIKTISSDTTLKNDVFINTASYSLRILGTLFSDITRTDDAISITAKPIKTSGQTYAASSFKIEKIEFADITAGTISGSSYNPNSGTQTDTFALTTGKNTFKVSVEDTDGNIAYSIFQVTKTLL